MKKGLVFLAALGLLALIGAISLQVRAISYIREIQQDTPQVIPEEEISCEPIVERLRSPHAILVLDVSGSMTDSDPTHLQTEAVLRFFEVYRDLSSEVLDHGDTPYLAVVLFSTIPQLIDWTGRGNPWLAVTSESTKTLSTVIDAYLGSAGRKEDPRLGQDTDHLAALEVVDELCKPLQSPPAILFMTDGIYELHPLFSPIVGNAKRQELGSDLSPDVLDACMRARQGEYRYLPANLSQGVFNRGDHLVPPFELPEEIAETVPSRISEAKKRILDRRFYLSDLNPRVGPLWAPVFLSRSETDENIESDIRSVLSGSDDPGVWKGQSPFIRCSNPEALVGEFVGVVARWFRLFKKDIADGCSSIQIPAQTQAFAVHLETRRSANHFRIRSSSTKTNLSGRGHVWSGVARGAGLFSFETDGGEIRGGTLYLRPRHDWALVTPAWFEVSGGTDTLDVKIFLVSLEEDCPVHVSDVFDVAPGSLPAEIRLGPRSFNSNLIKTDREDEGIETSPSYAASIPIEQTSTGEVHIRVDLKPLRNHDITTLSEELEHTLSARPRTRLLITDSNGRETAINLKGIPREADDVQKAWTRVMERIGR